MKKDISVCWLKSVDSTNNEAQRNASVSKDMTVWAAEFQTAGKGQRGNKWESETACNLTFSILLKPSNILAINQFVISQIATLGIADYLRANGIASKIKWPNDIYVEDRKICGILIENTVSSDKLSASVVGVGLNLNQRSFTSDAPNPTSMLLEMERNGVAVPPMNLRHELLLLLDNILSRYPVKSGDYDSISEIYIDNLYRLNERHSYIDLISNTTFEGFVRGIDKTARLIIETSDGSLRYFAFKELKYII